MDTIDRQQAQGQARWPLLAKLAALVAAVLALLGTALTHDAAGDALLLLVSLPVLAAIAFALGAFAGRDR